MPKFGYLMSDLSVTNITSWCYPILVIKQIVHCHTSTSKCQTIKQNLMRAKQEA